MQKENIEMNSNSNVSSVIDIQRIYKLQAIPPNLVVPSNSSTEVYLTGSSLFTRYFQKFVLRLAYQKPVTVLTKFGFTHHSEFYLLKFPVLPPISSVTI
ncbi:hypothetical protein AVEN_33252-1 [Araneus ventricosus]|uniref:Uncharacterized protein n=1 Tax=Araneus ventricosus TaxID=182803 RepID=A0A4Y2JA29_ARAVE|nr:hypothetical protein AVEN_33252-1 [Araneus ventricosus]